MNTRLFGGFPGGRFIGQEELDAVSGVLRARTPYRFYGPSTPHHVSSLEEYCCDFFERRHALAVSSGTAALQVALFAVGVSVGDEVILPAYGWGSDLMAILDRGAVPVIAPLDESLGLDPDALESCASDRTRAILAIHMRGAPCNLARIHDFAQARGIRVIEDGAQCLGGRIDGRPVGATGDISVFSFQYHKLVTAGEGGVVVTDDPELYERAYRFHDLGMFRRAGDADPEGLDSMMCFGLNFRMGEIQAALLRAQFERVPHILSQLQSAYQLGLETLGPFRDEFSLTERPLISQTIGNHAFLCLQAPTPQEAARCATALAEQQVPVQRCGRIDAHHFLAWEAYLRRDDRQHRVVASERDSILMDRSLFVEINAGYAVQPV